MSMAGLPGLARALAIDAMLPNQDQRIGQQVERNRQPPSFRPQHKLVLFQLFTPLVIDGHAEFIVKSRALLKSGRNLADGTHKERY